jgi:hypothetical protein
MLFISVFTKPAMDPYPEDEELSSFDIRFLVTVHLYLDLASGSFLDIFILIGFLTCPNVLRALPHYATYVANHTLARRDVKQTSQD